jgi:ribonuclease-3
VGESQLTAVFKKHTGYAFKDGELLLSALTHTSQTRTGGEDNERLEFLGDRILALVIAQHLYEIFPTASEGEMALRLNTMVRKETCAQIAEELHIGDMMKSIATKSASNKAVFDSRNVLGDACEAVLAAVYLDGGLEVARKFVLSAWEEMLGKNTTIRKDPKTTLQEWALGRKLEVPVYTEVSREGPDHSPEFIMSVQIDGVGKKSGNGTSKRAAEQDAAEKFLKSNEIKSQL